jgi:hypothetical protein
MVWVAMQRAKAETIADLKSILAMEFGPALVMFVVLDCYGMRTMACCAGYRSVMRQEGSSETL